MKQANPPAFVGNAGGFFVNPQSAIRNSSTPFLFCLMLENDMRILVVEDDNKIASFIVKGLKQAGYAVDRCADGEEGLVLAETTPYDAAVVDVMLPKLDGLSLIQRLRSQKIRTPVIILSAKASLDDRIKGLQAGGDDYLTKPFAFSELTARLHALIRRATQTSEPTRLTSGDLTLDLLTREVTRGGQKTNCRPASSPCWSISCATPAGP